MRNRHRNLTLDEKRINRALAARNPSTDKKGRKAIKRKARPNMFVSARLSAFGLDPDKVYHSPRWEEPRVDRVQLSLALHALVADGWSIEDRYVPEFHSTIAVQTRDGERIISTIGDHAAKLKRQGLAKVFARSPDTINRFLDIARRELAKMDASPEAWLFQTRRESGLTIAEIAALSTFCACWSRFQAAIGNVQHTAAAANGAPMTDEARAAIEAEYRDICNKVVKGGTARALDACRDLALQTRRKRWSLLRAAARGIDPSSVDKESV